MTTRLAVFGSDATLVALKRALADDVFAVFAGRDLADAAQADLALIDARAVGADLVLVVSAAIASTVLATSSEAVDLAARLPASAEIVVEETPIELIARHLEIRALQRTNQRDPLTGLLSRSALVARVASEAAKADGPRSLILLDIDHFKRHNDERGHLAGDAILAAAAWRLTEQAPPDAIVGRYGGEEFAIYLNADEASAMKLAESIVAAFRAQPCAAAAVRMSAGLATRSQPTDANELFLLADEALYTAKARGRDRAISYEQLEAAARASDRDVALEAFESRTKVIAERVAEAISARGRRLFGQLRERADIDPVTGLFSRGYLDRRLDLDLERARSGSQSLTCALVDLDHFGEVNKTYGWPTGDEALRQVSEALSENVRASDWVARYGGEELCIVMFGVDETKARALLERLVEVVSTLEIRASDGRSFGLTVSIGAASATSSDAAAELLERASQCLLAAKRAGRNRLAM